MPDELTTTEKVKKWQQRIALAKSYQEKFGDTDGRWKKHIKAMAGDFDSRQELGDEAIDVNVTYSTLQTMLPPLWIGMPYITIRPTTPRHKNRDNIMAAEYAEIEINYWLRELDVRQTCKRATMDMMATNHGYGYVGYVKDKADVQNEEGEQIEPIPTIRFKQPFIRRLSPRQVLLPPGHEFLDEAPWIAICWHKLLDDVKDRYGEKAENIKPSRALYPVEGNESVPAEMAQYLETDDCKMVDVYQVWVKREKMVYTVADGCDDFLDEGKWPYELEGFPIEEMRAVDIPDEYHGTPPIQYWYPQQKELNAARTAMRKRFNRSKEILITTGEVGDEFKNAYAKAQDQEVVTAGQSLEGGIGNHVMPLPPPAPDNNVLAYESLIKGDIRETSGLGSEQRGAGDPNVDSATASANIEKWTRVRSSDLGDRVRGFYIGIARKLWKILKQFPNEERTRLIAGDKAGMFTRVKYSLAEIDGEFEFDMDLSAMMADDPQTRLTQALANYNLMRADPLVNPEALVLDVFKAQNKPNPENYLQFLRQPEQEFQMMIQGLPVEAHERDDHEAHIVAHQIQLDELSNKVLTVTTVDPQFPESINGEKMRFTMALMLAHVNDHARQLQTIAGTVNSAGQPIAENTLRAQMKGVRGSETQAELAGQPLTAAAQGAAGLPVQ